MKRNKTVSINSFNADQNAYCNRQIAYSYDLEREKQRKYAELEEFINSIRNKGVEYKNKWFKCDSEAQQNLIKSALFLDSLLPLVWFTRDGYDGFIYLTSVEEFNEFKNIIANKMKEIENQYYQYRFAIDNAQTKEDIDLIIFQ